MPQTEALMTLRYDVKSFHTTPLWWGHETAGQGLWRYPGSGM